MRIFHPDIAPVFRNRRSGKLVRICTVHYRGAEGDLNDDSIVWAVYLEDGTKNFWKLSVFEQEFAPGTTEPISLSHLCAHCGFLEVDQGEALCPYCRDRFQ